MPAARGVLPKLATGVVLAGGAVAAFLAGPLPLAAFVGALYFAAYLELRALLTTNAAGSRVTLGLGALAVVGFVAAAYDRRVQDLPWVLAALVLAALVSRILMVELGRGRAEGATVDVASTVAAAGVVGLLGAHLVLIRMLPHYGFRGALVFGLMVLPNQGFAFITGRIFGRHPLAPRVSPAKSWEGLAGGTIATLVAGLVAGLVLHPPFTVASGLILGAVIAVAAPIGDLAESALKRGAGVKDSGRWLPGQGGALDVLDGLLFSAPIFYWALRTLVI
jgi:phosphatidate cytidylyltransferase